jgi:signal transduction histidine kinase
VSLETRAEAFKQSIEKPDFVEHRAEANRAYSRQDYESEVEIYRSMSKAPDSNQQNFARLLWAGALMRAGRTQEGIALYRVLLKLPSDVVDEFGYPLAFYKDSIDALLSKDSSELEREVLYQVRQEIGSFAALSRTKELLASILEKLVTSRDPEVRRDATQTTVLLAERTKELERMRSWPEARDLQEAFANKTLVVTNDVWPARTFASGEIWLIGRTFTTEPSVVIAVRADEIRKRFDERGQSLKLVSCEPGDSSHESLGSDLPGLCVQPPAPPVESSRTLLWLFAMALAFVGILGPAFLWLLWRDTRREVHLAELRSQFVSSVSHELKTPLTAIRMFAETLQIRKTDGPKHAQYVEIIISESERLTRLLNNVLDFSRIERGQQSYQMQVTPLSDVVQSVARTMRFPLTAQGFDFRVEVSDSVPPTAIDRDAIEQAVLNLLSNAMKYSGEKRDIALSLRRHNGSALIQVADCGIGIPAEEHQRIFEKFYRVQTPDNQTISGAGLGLALVAHIANAHGGNVEVESAMGRGSTFTIRLPITHAGKNEDRVSGDES